jgi:hypothetical protein
MYMTKLEDQIKTIESIEKKIEREERKIESLEDDLLQQLNRQPRVTLFRGPKNKRLKYVHTLILKRLMRYRIVYSFLVVSGIVLVWRGIWELADQLPIIKIPLVSIVFGLMVLWLTQRTPDGN